MPCGLPESLAAAHAMSSDHIRRLTTFSSEGHRWWAPGRRMPARTPPREQPTRCHNSYFSLRKRPRWWIARRDDPRAALSTSLFNMSILRNSSLLCIPYLWSLAAFTCTIPGDSSIISPRPSGCGMSSQKNSSMSRSCRKPDEQALHVVNRVEAKRHDFQSPHYRIRPSP